jgi:adenylyltransferase/sulfurtransferase
MTSYHAGHLNLVELNDEKIAKLNSSKILCIGSGGLSATCTTYLATAGIGTIGIMDYDKIELSNLQRQTMFSKNDIGKFKVEVLAQKLRQQNNEINIIEYCCKFDSQNEIVSNYDLVIDCADNKETTLKINAVCKNLKKPWVFGAVEKFGGQVGLFTPQTQCFCCLFGEEKEEETSCSDMGIFAPTVGIFGIIQASETIKYLTELQCLAGKLLTIDILDMHTKTYEFSGKCSCPN